MIKKNMFNLDRMRSFSEIFCIKRKAMKDFFRALYVLHERKGGLYEANLK
jgi:hypothetical protein